MRDIIRVEKKHRPDFQSVKPAKESSTPKEIKEEKKKEPLSKKHKKNEGRLWKVFAWLFILLPVFFVPGGIVSFGISKTMFFVSLMLIVAFVYFVSVLVTGKMKIPNHKFFLALLALPLVYFLSAIVSSSFSESFSGLFFEVDTVLMTLLFTFVVMFSVLLFSSVKRLVFLYKGLFLAFIVVALFQIVKIVVALLGGSFTLGVFPEVSSNLIGKWNDLGMYAGLFMILSLITLEMPLNRIQKIVTNTVFGLSLLLLILVNFDLAWIVIGIFSLLYFVYTFSFGLYHSKQKKENKERPQVPVKPLFVFLVSLVFLIGGTSISTPMYSYLDISEVEVRPSWGATLEMAGKSFKDNPLLGAGPNNFREQWILHKPAEINSTVFWNTNFNNGIGILPTSIVTTGVLGVLAWLGVLFYLVYVGFSNIGRRTEDSELVYIEISSFAGAIFSWIFLILYIPNIVMMAFTFLFTGIFFSIERKKGSFSLINMEGSANQREAFVVSLVTITLLIGIIGWAYSSVTRFVASMYYQKGVSLISEVDDIKNVKNLVQKATRYHSHDLYYRALSDISLAELNQLVSQTDPEEEEFRSEFQNKLSVAIENARTAISIDDREYLNWLRLGEIYSAITPLGIDGAYENALNAYDEAGNRNPSSPEIDLRKARLEASRGSLDEARSHLQGALAKKNNYTEAVFLLSQVEAESGNMEEAIRATESAALLVPNDPTIFFQLGLLHYNQGGYSEAIPALTRAVTLFPSYSNAKYFLGLSYFEESQAENAISEFEGLLELNPENTEVATILENLKNGESPFSGNESSSPQSRNELPIEEE